MPVTSSTKKIASVTDFASESDGAWQRFPASIIDHIRAERPDVILKGGMSLLRIPSDLACPVLSYHHGDPEAYRGRPAGFYETLHGKETLGQIVQVLSNKLDAGSVVAFGETKVYPHSYRATLIESYRHSKLLINGALRNIAAGRTLAKRSQGKNYRLPSNALVALFAIRMAGCYLRRIFYGAFFEKKWQVSTAPLAENDLALGQFPPRADWKTLTKKLGHTFYADPFYSAEPRGILVEAMRGKTGKGDIVLVSGDEQSIVSDPLGHYSYPASVTEGSESFVVPETAAWSPPMAFRLDGGKLQKGVAIQLPGDPRVVDPTFVRHQGRLYLFGNVSQSGCNALYLWSAKSLFEPFDAHPANPIRISPKGSRMAGGILKTDKGLVRFGQSFLGNYGDGVFAFAIEAMSPTEYREREAGQVRFEGVRGPHTIDVRNDAPNGEVVFDWYCNRFSPLAGVRRLIGKLS
jgi:hypothetical protein